MSTIEVIGPFKIPYSPKSYDRLWDTVLRAYPPGTPRDIVAVEMARIEVGRLPAMPKWPSEVLESGKSPWFATEQRQHSEQSAEAWKNQSDDIAYLTRAPVAVLRDLYLATFQTTDPGKQTLRARVWTLLCMARVPLGWSCCIGGLIDMLDPFTHDVYQRKALTTIYGIKFLSKDDSFSHPEDIWVDAPAGFYVPTSGPFDDSRPILAIFECEYAITIGTITHFKRTRRLPADSWLKILPDLNTAIKRRIASWTSTPNKVLAKLAEDQDVIIRQHVASNKNAPAKVLLRLSEDIDTNVRCEVALNPNTSKNVLTALSGDIDINVVSMAVCNKNTPQKILDTLASEPSQDTAILARIAGNRSTSKTILVVLSGHQDKCIRSSVARNINTPADKLVRLSEDEDADVRWEASQNPGYKASKL